MPVQIEQVVNSGMALQKSLCLVDRLETSHASFAVACRLVREFRSIVGVLFCVVFRLRDQ